MDILDEEFGSFKNSVSRMRWFVITLVMISVLILIHIYLEQYGFQEQQLKMQYGFSLQNYAVEKQECLKALTRYKQHKSDNILVDEDKVFLNDNCSEKKIPIKDLNEILKKELPELIKSYSESNFEITKAGNTLKDTKLQIRSIPLLGIEVPANDFTPIMSLISLIFMVGLWINLRGIIASLYALKKYNDPKLMGLARINTVFLTHLETIQGQKFAKIIRNVAIWLPLMSILTAFVANCVYPKIENCGTHPKLNFGLIEYINIHCFIGFTLIVLHTLVVRECTSVMKDINNIFHNNNL